LKIIPYSVTWGGRLENDKEMYLFESVSIVLNGFLVWILLMKDGITKQFFSNKTLRIILWIFFILFLLNTIGNLFAKSILEKQFAILTGIIAFLLHIILKQKND